MKPAPRISWAVGSIALALFAATPRATAGARVEAATVIDVGASPDADVMLLALRVENTDLDVLLPAYPATADTLVPLDRFCRALGLRIDVDPERGLAEGFLVSERRPFRLDVLAREAHVAGRRQHVDSSGVALHPDDIYVSTALLAAWIPAQIRIDARAAVLVIRSASLMPVLAQRERRIRAQRDLGPNGSAPPTYPRVEIPYHVWSGPFVDQTLRSTSMRGPIGRSDTWEYSTYATGEVLYLDGDLRLNGNRTQPVAEVAGGLGRGGAEPDLFGPLRARQFRVGEFASPGLSLIMLPTVGTGVVLSSFPLQQPDQFDRHTFQGSLPPEWDVELYREGTLIGYQASQPDGRYEFPDVPLTVGANTFRLVLHGPGGEQREETRVFNVGPSLTAPGQHYYRLALCDPVVADRRAYVETNLSLARGLSAAFGAAALDGAPGVRRFATGGLRASWNRVFVTADLAGNDGGGAASEAGLQTLCGPVALAFRHALLNRFESETFRPTLAPIRSRTSARLDAMLLASGTVRLPFQVELTTDRLHRGQSVQVLSNRLSLGIRNVSITHQMRQVVASAELAVNPETRNAVFLSTQIRRYALRGTVEYDPLDAWRARSLDLLAEGATWVGGHAAIGANRNMQVQDTRYVVSLRQGQGPLGWSLRSEHGERSGSTVILSLSVGLSRDPQLGRWYPHAQPVAGTGAASVRVFLDDNGNGTHDPGESPIEGSRLSLDRAPNATRTGPEGVAFLGGLPTGRPLDVSLMTGSLEDPLWMPAQPGLTIVPRPGRTALIDYPVRITGEVTGSVAIRRHRTTRPAAGITLELMDLRTHEAVRQTTTLYDGSYDIAGVLPGRYELRVIPAQTARSRSSSLAVRQFEIEPSGAILDGVDLVLDAGSLATGEDD